VHTCMCLCELTGICTDTFEVWDFTHIMAFLVFRIQSLVFTNPNSKNQQQGYPKRESY